LPAIPGSFKILTAEAYFAGRISIFEGIPEKR
jgi:hypothetical protein